ncbi:MAG: DJ-1/PfpI family protein, partial [bacterium]|nr:DJ-1/PfpI family protein [bacterium]
MKTCLVAVADGTEELEAVAVIDTLRRAGVQVTVASVGGRQVTCSRGVTLVADCLISECVQQSFDAIALPGGMPGAEHLRDNAVLTDLLRRQHAAGRLLAA